MMRYPLLQRRLSRRAFLRRSAQCVLTAGTLASGGMAYAGYIEPGWVEVRRVPLSLPRLPVEFDGYSIAQISDIHMDGDWMTHDRLSEVVALVNGEQADLVAITGDFVTHSAERFVSDLGCTLSGLRVP